MTTKLIVWLAFLRSFSTQEDVTACLLLGIVFCIFYFFRRLAKHIVYILNLNYVQELFGEISQCYSDFSNYCELIGTVKTLILVIFHLPI